MGIENIKDERARKILEEAHNKERSGVVKWLIDNSPYKKHPWLNKPSYHALDKLGYVGEDGVIPEGVPAMWESYAKPYKQLAQDVRTHGLNWVGDSIDFFKYGLTGLNEMRKIGPLTPGTPQGNEAAKTWMMDALGNSFLRDKLPNWFKPTDMEKDYGESWEKYAHPDHAKFFTGEHTDEKAKAYFDNLPSLDNWDMYQYWKRGSRAWDTADTRRIDKKVDKKLGKIDFSHDSMWPEFLGLSKEYPHIIESEEAINWYYDEMVKNMKDFTKKSLSNEIEFEETGQHYADWAGKSYRDDMISKYGRYLTVEDEIVDPRSGTVRTPYELMSMNIDPYHVGAEDKSWANLEYANKEYMEALKDYKNNPDIGTPTEFDYGAWDSDDSVGVSKDTWYDYTTPEAAEVFDSTQLMAAEMIGTLGITAPLKAKKLMKPFTKWLNTSRSGRILKEAMPGTFQWGSRKNFGLPRFDHVGKWRKALNAGLWSVDWLRPKFGQLGAAVVASEYFDQD